MEQYLNLIEELDKYGRDHDNRTGINTVRKIFHHDVYQTNGGTKFNAVTHKKLAVKGVIAELLGFIQGTDNADVFGKLGCNVWYENANKDGVRPNQWLRSPFRKGENDLGRIYGVQWRNWEDVKIIDVYEPDTKVLDHMLKMGYEIVMSQHNFAGKTYVLRRRIDQLQNAVNSIIKDPNSRRIIISAWNPADIEQMALPPCHVLQQYLCTELTPGERATAYRNSLDNDRLWYTHSGNRNKALLDVPMIHSLPKDDESLNVLMDDVGAPKYRTDLIMYQRSADVVLGSPFNISSYDAMLNIMGRITNTEPGDLHYVTADTHIYKNHGEAVKEMLDRGVHPENKARLLINPALKTLKDFEKATTDDFMLTHYSNFGKLKSPTPMAI